MLDTVPNASRVHLEQWVAEAASLGVGSSFRVLDAGAGRAPCRHLFGHVSYETADFGGFEGDYEYGEIDYVCDLASIPVEDDTFDLVLCTQVLEHVPDPVTVLTELKRIVKPGGQIRISAPLFYEEHNPPHDFWRFTQFGWRYLAEQSELEIVAMDWLEGYYGTLSYQLHRAARSLPRTWLPVSILFIMLAQLLAKLDVKKRVTDRGMPKNYRCVMVAR